MIQNMNKPWVLSLCYKTWYRPVSTDIQSVVIIDNDFMSITNESFELISSSLLFLIILLSNCLLVYVTWGDLWISEFSTKNVNTCCISLRSWKSGVQSLGRQTYSVKMQSDTIMKKKKQLQLVKSMYKIVTE